MPRVLAGLDAIHRVALGINPAPIGDESGEETLPTRRVNIHRNFVAVPRSVDVREYVEVAVPVDVQRTSAAETAPLGYRQRRRASQLWCNSDTVPIMAEAEEVSRRVQAHPGRMTRWHGT